MSISLRPETEKRIEDRMRMGRYSSPDDVVAAGLRLMEERELERREDLGRAREKIAVGLAELDRGEGLDGDAVFEELLAELEREGGQR